MPGAVAFEQVPSYIAAMDVPVVPYAPMVNFYFSPIKLFESMASGRPTVAARIGQLADVIDHGRTGWLYEPGNAGALADGLRCLLSHPALALEIGQAGRSLVTARHT